MRTRAERMALWGSVAALVGSCLPWGSEVDGAVVWGLTTAGAVTFVLAGWATWRALMWGSPVGIGIALAGVLVVWAVGFVVVASTAGTVSGLIFVVPVGAVVGLVGAFQQAPER